MKWYELVFGLCSFVGMIVSVFTLITTRRTKAALKEYRKKLDAEKLKSALTRSFDGLNQGEVNQKEEFYDSIQREMDRYLILHKDSISPDLETAMTTAKNSISSMNETPEEDKNAQGILKSNLSLVAAYLEKELV